MVSHNHCPNSQSVEKSEVREVTAVAMHWACVQLLCTLNTQNNWLNYVLIFAPFVRVAAAATFKNGTACEHKFYVNVARIACQISISSECRMQPREKWHLRRPKHALIDLSMPEQLNALANNYPIHRMGALFTWWEPQRSCSILFFCCKAPTQWISQILNQLGGPAVLLCPDKFNHFNTDIIFLRLLRESSIERAVFSVGT